MSEAELDESRLRRLIDVGRGLVAELDLEVVLRRVLEVARELTGARFAALGILDEERRELERFLTSGVDDETRRRIGDLPRGRGILGVLIGDPRPLRLSDLTQHPHSYGFPAGHPPMRTFLGAPVLIRGEAYGNLYLAEKDGGEFDALDEESLVILAEWAGIAIENARLYEGVERRRRELERAVRSLEATTTIALAVGGETELDRVLELIVKRGRALVEARALVILLQDRDELVVAATAGDLPSDLHGARVPVEGSVGGEVLRSGRPERFADVSQRLRPTLGALGVQAQSGLFVPLLFRGGALGVLEAFDRLGGAQEFGADDERLMLSFAASAATAVATAQSVQEDRLRHTLEAAEQERRRWARELHDETLQGLGALRVLLSSALRGREAEGLRTAAADAVGQLGTEIDNLRALITELRPAALDELGLQPAIEALAQRAQTVEGLIVEAVFDGLDGTARIAPELESTAYRLVQEALTNVAKHSHAEQVCIRLGTDDGLLTVTVRDDGVGIEDERRQSGFGLMGMRERVELAGGRLEIRRRRDKGTTVHAEMPLRYAARTAGADRNVHRG